MQLRFITRMIRLAVELPCLFAKITKQLGVSLLVAGERIRGEKSAKGNMSETGEEGMEFVKAMRMRTRPQN